MSEYLYMWIVVDFHGKYFLRLASSDTESKVIHIPFEDNVYPPYASHKLTIENARALKIYFDEYLDRVAE